MANNLYDTGAPKRVIVEYRHEYVHRVELEPSAATPGPRDKKKPIVTITPQFEEVPEKTNKLLTPGS